LVGCFPGKQIDSLGAPKSDPHDTEDTYLVWAKENHDHTQ
jgi:hypothetical protein